MPSSNAAAIDPIPALHTVLDLPVRIFERPPRRCLVALDEFQSIAHVPGAEEILCSHIELQGQAAASYIFAGSEAGMMRQLFGERARPLFGQAKPVTLGPAARSRRRPVHLRLLPRRPPRR